MRCKLFTAISNGIGHENCTRTMGGFIALTIIDWDNNYGVHSPTVKFWNMNNASLTNCYQSLWDTQL